MQQKMVLMVWHSGLRVGFRVARDWGNGSPIVRQVPLATSKVGSWNSVGFRRFGVACVILL